MAKCPKCGSDYVPPKCSKCGFNEESDVYIGHSKSQETEGTGRP